MVAPTGEGRHGWFVRKLQTLLKKEFEEGIIHKDADDLKEGDRDLESRADRAPRQSRAQKAAPSDGDEAAASKEKRRRGRSKRKAVLEPVSMRRMTSLKRATRWSSCSRSSS